jgi:hypothetical protein
MVYNGVCILYIYANARGTTLERMARKQLHCKPSLFSLDSFLKTVEGTTQQFCRESLQVSAFFAPIPWSTPSWVPCNQTFALPVECIQIFNNHKATRNQLMLKPLRPPLLEFLAPGHPASGSTWLRNVEETGG